MTSGGFVSLGRVKASDEFKSKLFRYALEGKAKKIEVLFANNPGSSCDIDSCNTRGQTCLFVTCMSRHYKCVTTLLQLGANPNRRSDDGSTACHAAAFSCHTIMLQALVDQGGDLRLHDNRDLMPRDWAVEAGIKKNRKMLELIDSWQGETMKKILSTSYSEKLTTSCSTKSLRLHSKPTNISTTTSTLHFKQTGFLNNSFGDFVAIELIKDSNTSLQGKQEIGYKSIIPVVNAQHLNCIENELTGSYNVPPYFTLCDRKWGNQNVTIKKIRKMKRKPTWQHASTTDLLIAEQKIHSLLRHNHILLLMGIGFDGNTDMKDTDSLTRYKNSLLPQQFVYERINLGTLYHLLHEKKYSFPIYDSITFLIQSADALSYLHQRGLIHCCVTSHSIYIVDHNSAKLSDFYYAVHSEEKAGISNQVSPAFNRWLAPEILAGKNPTFESDIYSFCVLVSEVLSGVLPWKGFDPDSVRHQIVSKGRMMTIPDNIPDHFYPILCKGLSISRRKRTYHITNIGYQLEQFLKSDNVLLASSTIKSPHDISTLRSCSLLINERNSFKPYGDLPDAAPYVQHSLTEPDSRANIDQNYLKVTPIRAETKTLIPSGLQKLESSFTSKPPIPIAAVRNAQMDNSNYLSENSIKNSTLNSVKVSVYNGLVQQRTPTNSQNRSIMMERFLNDESNQLNHSLDEDLVGVHPDLLDTDSRDSSLNAENQNSVASLCNQPNIPENTSVTPTYRPLAKERSIRVTARTPSGSNQVKTSERSSPYPDLTERRNSPGEYVLSGLPAVHAERSQNMIEEDKSSMTLASSYLAQVYPNKANQLEKESDTPHRSVPKIDTNDKDATELERHNSKIDGPEYTEADSQQTVKNSDANLQTSVHKVYNSFVELSKMITPRSENDEDITTENGSTTVKENAVKSPHIKQLYAENEEKMDLKKLAQKDDITLKKSLVKCQKQKKNSKNTKNLVEKNAKILQKMPLFDDKDILDDDSLLHSNTEDFFNEVISAAGIDYPGQNLSETFKKTETKTKKKNERNPENVLKSKTPKNKPKNDVAIPQKKENQQKTAEAKPRGKKSKVRGQKRERGKFPSVQMKSEVLDVSSNSKQRPRKKHQNDLEKRNLNTSAGKVEVLFSNFPSNLNKMSSRKSKVDDIVEQMSQDFQIDPEFDDPALDAELQDLMKESQQLVTKATKVSVRDVPFPSGAIENTSRKKSKSPDLVDLFGQFANRNQTQNEENPKERRFSMTSNDLEDVFADFANRKSHENCEDNQILDQDSVGIDMVESPVVYTTAEPSNQNNEIEIQGICPDKKVKITRASQTSELDIHLAQCDKFSQTESKTKKSKTKPKNPPRISSFIKNAKSKSSEPGFLVQTSDFSSQTEGFQELTQLLESGIENLNRPFDIFSPRSNQKNMKSRKSLKQERAIIPASHLQPSLGHALALSYQPPSATSSQTSPRYIQTDGDLRNYQQITSKNKNLENLDDVGYQSPVGNEYQSDGSKSLEKTPSKWSFHRKLSVFESKSTQSQPDDVSNQVSATFITAKEQKTQDDQNVEDRNSDTTESDDTNTSDENVQNFSKNELKSTQTCDNASGDSHSIMYTTALESTENQASGTPANLPRIRSLINTEKAKTSTPVYHKPFLFNQDSEQNLKEQQNLNESYSKVMAENNQDSTKGCRQNNVNFVPGFLNLDHSSTMINNSSLLQMSMIPRSVYLPDVSTESNATFGEESHPVSKPKKIIPDKKNPVKNKQPESQLTSKKEVSFLVNTGPSLLSNDTSSALSKGIGQLSTMLADEAIEKESKILLSEKVAENTVDLSENFSGISYDEVNENVKQEENITSPDLTNEKPENDNVDGDTSVWAESQVSNQMQEYSQNQHYQVSDEEYKEQHPSNKNNDADATASQSSEEECYDDEEFADDMEEEEQEEEEEGDKIYSSSEGEKEEFSDEEN